ncbi:MAG: FAD-binding protein [Acidimicrobiia bacterium]
MSTDRMQAFADEIGPAGPVTCVGGRTQWDVGGSVDPKAREVCAPAGIIAFDPAEMTVKLWAGTTVAELDAALAGGGQMVALPDIDGATVGGVLAVGHSSIHRLADGHVRDTLLQARVVMADGNVMTAGGPTVKNVTGFDLCRVLVGSLGTLGFIGEVILRTRPRPVERRWLRTESDPFALAARLFRPASILWDGTSTWVCLAGHPLDVAAQAALVPDATHVDGPPWIPSGRASLRPSQLRTLPSRANSPFVAEVGVGIVHTDSPDELRPSGPATSDTSIVAIHHRLSERFDPTGRFNPGRKLLES